MIYVANLCRYNMQILHLKSSINFERLVPECAPLVNYNIFIKNIQAVLLFLKSVLSVFYVIIYLGLYSLVLALIDTKFV